MSEEKKKNTKRISKKIIVRLKNTFHKCRYVNKSTLQDCYREDIFCLFFY